MHVHIGHTGGGTCKFLIKLAQRVGTEKVSADRDGGLGPRGIRESGEHRWSPPRPAPSSPGIDEASASSGPTTVNQHLAAIRTLFDYFVVGHVVPANPASEVRGPRSIATKTRTPVLGPDRARRLMESID